MKKLITLLVALMAMGVYSAMSQELPENPAPGKCYIKCITVDEFAEITETIEVSPTYKKLRVIPATYKTVEEKVLIKEATKKLVYVPAVFETVEVPYVNKEASRTLEVIPASFGSASKTFEVYPKTAKWEYTTLPNCPSANRDDCVVACFVEYPEKTETIPITTLTKDASTRETPIGEIRATYKKQIVKTPARMDEIEIPAEYTTIKRQVIDKPAQVVEEVVPAITRTITKTILTKKGGMAVWEEVDCSVTGLNILPILYEYNSARLTPESTRIIDETLLKLMKEKPALRVEIMSHTDSRGNDEYNMSLSQQRAQSVVNYLVSNGISRNRLVARGYGESRLKNRCSNGVDCSEAEHQENRRTEFRILQ
ncbi:MAG: OmpA family protein [Bacteroidales bacterium]|nr:OmpA family protein [Lentimicrobiaceae bacterium]MDD5695436.1 OmpA family protein [Bacteroidales bacterium]